jgi:hypothetical protein
MEFPGYRLGARAGATGDEMLKGLQEIDQVLLRDQPSEKAEAEAMAAVRKWMGGGQLRREQRDRLDQAAITTFAKLFSKTRRLNDDRVEDVQRTRRGACRGPHLAGAIGCHVNERATFTAPGDPTQRPEERGGWYLCENDNVMVENLDHAMTSQQNKVRRRNTACPSERLSLHIDPGLRDFVEKLVVRTPAQEAYTVSTRHQHRQQAVNKGFYTAGWCKPSGNEQQSHKNLLTT